MQVEVVVEMERRPSDAQLTREVIERWNEHCDSLELEG